MLKNEIRKISLVLLGLVFTTLSAFGNTITGIDVNQDEKSKFSIVIDIDQKAEIKKVDSNKDTLSIIITSVVPAENVIVNFENSKDLKNIVVQRKNKDNTLIVLEGTKIENAKVFTNNIKTGEIEEIKFSNNTLKTIFMSLLGLFTLISIRTKIINNRKRNNKIEDPNELMKKKIQEVNTLRKKNKEQSKNAPTINYKKSDKRTTIPEGLTINNYKNYQAKRKVG